MSADELGRLMLVFDRAGCGACDPLATVRAAVEGGVSVVQLRERELPDDELQALASALVATVGADATVVVNGRPAVAETVGCGLHLPAASIEIPVAGRPLGASVHDADEVDRALAVAVDYLVAGTIFETTSKPGRPGAGLDHLAAIVRRAHPIPVYAIGGITPERARVCRLAGAHGAAVRSGILAAPDPRTAAAAYRTALDGR